MEESIRGSFSAGVGTIGRFLPHLLSGIVILVVGYVVSILLARLARTLLLRLRFDQAIERRVHHRLSTGSSPTETVRSVVFWLGMLVTFTMTADALGLQTLALGLHRILGFVPHVIVAAAIAGVGFAVGGFLGRLVGDVTNVTIARVTRISVIVFASFMALDELGIARHIVMTTFTALLGAAAVAAAIAFGVGNIGLAGRYSRKWARRGEEELQSPEPPESERPIPH